MVVPKTTLGQIIDRMRKDNAIHYQGSAIKCQERLLFIDGFNEDTISRKIYEQKEDVTLKIAGMLFL